ncbi:TRAP transporter substrate-binding protein [Pseudomonas sp. GX19020]|uniref:TRAP transporter substrate-binding protein n=1 Tax=Pseudomonas sp. GX19020 TaxID=2942277 RepID=UPI002018B6C2|nr:TRAP transporter substrate-binding protein [Pseudomonas sp. GX19020]MCL4068036.1 TRAP transporter substrate-binding protein [Pseudomonas sp. GX19020]
MTLTRRNLLLTATAAGLLAAPLLPRKARAATPITIASLFGDDKPETLVWVKFAELVEAKLPGAFHFNLVKNAALGGEKEVAEAIRLGSIQGSLSTVSALSGWVPESQILDLPFLFRDAAHLERTTSGVPGQRLQDLFRAQSFEVPAFINYGARHLLTKTPVTTPDQLQGVKIRVIQSPLHTQLWSAYDAVPTGIPIPETYNALSTGVVDAMDLTKSAYAGFKLYEVVPHLTETAHIWAAGVIYFSAAFWGGLSDDQKTVFTAAAVESARHFNELIVADEAASVETARAAGGKVHQPEDRAAWEAGAKGVWESLAPVVGGLDAIEAIRAL